MLPGQFIALKLFILMKFFFNIEFKNEYTILSNDKAKCTGTNPLFLWQINQRTNGPINAHLRSLISTAN